MTSGRPEELTCLHEASTLIIWSSRVLTLGETVLWFHTWRLDNTPADGCYLGPQALSDRLGGKLASSTIEEYRANMRELGLLAAFRRAEGRNMGWVATFPGQLLEEHKDFELKKWGRGVDELAAARAALLDTYLLQFPDRLARSKQSDPVPVRGRGGTRLAVGSQSGRQSGYDPTEAAAWEEGREEGASSHPPVSRAEAQLPPVVRDLRGETEAEDRSARAREQTTKGGPRQGQWRRVGNILGNLIPPPPPGDDR